MARFRRRAGAVALGPSEQQTTIFDRFGSIARLVETPDPARPAAMLLCVCLAMMGLGLLLQASHAATILSPERFAAEVVQQAGLRVLGVLVLLGAWRLGPADLRRVLPVLVVVAGLLLLCVWVPHVGKPENGAHRWIRVPFAGLSFQPSELARVVMVVWVADRCTRLGEELSDLRRGVLPIFFLGFLFFGLIATETDIGGALLFLGCFVSTLWVGGARFLHAAGSVAAIGGAGFVLAVSSLEYIRGRLAVFFGQAQNEQVSQAIQALGSGKLLGVGVGRGLFRNSGIPYQDSDYVFALVGEELGLFGMLVCLGLIFSFVWFSLRLVLSIPDRFAALAAFGLLLSVSVQAMLHMQVVTGLAPPKGMTLPFISDGGTSLVISSLAVGLALGAARPRPSHDPLTV